MNDNFFKKLSPKEEKKFRRWARKNWKPGDPIDSLWHPVVRNEIEKMQTEIVIGAFYEVFGTSLNA